MTDLLDAESVAMFKDAMRDLTDTFYKIPVILEQAGGDTGLLCGRKLITSELQAREGGEETEEGYRLTFNRADLAEMGLVDANDKLLIGYDDTVVMDGKQFAIVGIAEPVIFREEKLMVTLEVAR